jgi:hypothetical protein
LGASKRVAGTAWQNEGMAVTTKERNCLITAAGSTMRVAYQEQTGGAPTSVTNWVTCHPPHTMTFEVAGMYPSTAYNMFAQTKTGSTITDSSTVTFTTSALPKGIPFPTFAGRPAGTDTAYPVILHNPITFVAGTTYPDIATDLTGKIIWYYQANDVKDFVFKIDYKDGAGTKNILWRMGPTIAGASGDFTFVNTWNDPWPWFSHQHDFGIENGGAGPSTIFDNGDTRTAPVAQGGLGGNCAPFDCNSRGMAITFSESTMQVRPVVSFDLGSYSTAMGSAQLLSNGNYFFENPIVFVVSKGTTFGYSMEIAPTNPTPQVGPASVNMNVVGPQHYRGFQMQSLYVPPTT